MPLIRTNDWTRDGKVIRGSWRLTRRHELQYVRRGAGEEILLSGPILRAGSTGLTFRAAQQSMDENVLGRQFTLRGTWRADPENHLEFVVDGQRDGAAKALTFEGAWELAGRQIIYRLRSESGQTLHVLRFEGKWDIDEDKRLVYLLERSSGSGFRFLGAFQTPSILEKKGEIRYQLGGEIQGRPKGPVITLFGKWKLSRTLGLSFELPCRNGRVQGIDFGAVFSPGSDGDIAVELQTRKGKPLGVELTLRRRFFEGQGELFARVRRSFRESAVEGGVRFRW